MYLGLLSNGYLTHRNYGVTGGTIAEVVENMRTLFTHLEIIEEFDEEEIIFYYGKELLVQKRVEYVITSEIT